MNTAYLKPGSKWYNELGSAMIITGVNQATGSSTGTYNSAVGKAIKEYGLQAKIKVTLTQKAILLDGLYLTKTNI